jgi:hypothetical protein
MRPCAWPTHADAVVRQRPLAWHGEVLTADQPHLRDRLVRGAKGGGVTNVVRAPVRPATLWRRVVSIASANVIAGRRVVSRRASIDVPAPGGPRRRT